MEIQARLEAFGVDSARVTLEVMPRGVAWRVARAVGFGLPGLLLVGLSILPPHALWALSGLVLVTVSVRKFSERYTVTRMDGRCPHCGAKLSDSSPTRLRLRSSVTCEGCQRSSELVIDPGALSAHRAG